jgi:hypothetical protein
VLIFDHSKNPDTPFKSDVCVPNLRLKGLSLDGYGLGWNDMKTGKIFKIKGIIASGG